MADDVAPSRSTAFWLAVFYTAGPVGVACGFFLGSVLGSNMSWRYVFLFEASVALPFVLWCFVTKPFDIQRDCETSNDAVAEGQGAENGGFSVWRDLKRLLKHVVYDLSISGELLQFAFLTLCEYWGGRMAAAVFNSNQSDIVFGAVIVVGCIIGGVLGGVILDAIGNSYDNTLLIDSCFFCRVFRQECPVTLQCCLLCHWNCPGASDPLVGRSLRVYALFTDLFCCRLTNSGETLSLLKDLSTCRPAFRAPWQE